MPLISRTIQLSAATCSTTRSKWSTSISHIGRALKKLEELGELDNTLVVMTSDHGMPFPRVKGQIYEPGYHIPLAVRWGKNITGGRTVDDFINTRDFAPTFLQAAGVAVAGSMTGRSFLDVLRSAKNGNGRYFTE